MLYVDANYHVAGQFGLDAAVEYVPPQADVLRIGRRLESRAAGHLPRFRVAYKVHDANILSVPIKSGET